MAKNKRKIKRIVLISLLVVLIYCIVFSYYSPLDFYFTGEPPLIKESKYLVYHYFPFSKQAIDIDKIIKSDEESLLYACKLFEMEPPDEKIHIYLFRNLNEYIKHTGRNCYSLYHAYFCAPSVGDPSIIKASFAPIGVHEFVHLCCFYKWGDKGSSKLAEPTAYFITHIYKEYSYKELFSDDNPTCFPETPNYISKYFLEKGELMGLLDGGCLYEESINYKPDYSSLLTKDDSTKNLSIQFAGYSFLSFLFDKYGLDKYEELYKSKCTTKDLEKIYGKTCSELTEEWKNYILLPPKLSEKEKERVQKLIKRWYKLDYNQYELQNSIEENFIKGKYFDAAKDSISLFYNYLHFGLGGSCNDTEAKLFRAKYFLSASLEERGIFKQKILPLLRILTLNLIITPYYYLIYSRYFYFIIAAILAIILLLIFFK